MKNLIYYIVILCFFIFAFARCNTEDKELEELFKKKDIEGTIIISNLDGGIEYLYNSKRASKRFLPASTFKILNTLIALEESAVVDINEIIKWDRKDKGFSSWNKDHSIKTAFPVSCVWFYQELAKRVGNEKYLSHLNEMDYGNENRRE